ncbi:triose-phosphate isomerase [Gluconobacter kanchanaburiensis]|uniref:Triosephosphate isomerase n=1 Tax=Gluconobacter kanchanaburiensis NBRC 103587 TaxID=1307948 RepID=A0A511BF67_9PROT|nr:triose-phosphate isomerase [Gluconobacter kanchanaburiensis]GBR68597.1 triosephosphate isomerase [Gluconobacter kanchanaburiensis NBRC 103587]GEK96417.1 triosephosphate isomerase [Gluconobacter kanchanaburiensis NBRC 103587]
MDQKSVWVGTNWKMNKGPGEAIAAADALASFKLPEGVRAFVTPPLTSLKDVASILQDSPVMVGAQTMYWEDSGAWTGEVSAPMIAECGASCVLLGHSERRQNFGETDWTVNRKVQAALRHGLRPLICIGDLLDEYEAGVSQETLARQTKIALNGLSREDLRQVVVIYEPVWAIGSSGRPADPPFVSEIHTKLRSVVEEIAGHDGSIRIPLLYGGSVSRANIRDYVALSDVDGVLIGRAGWDPEDFMSLIASVGDLVSVKAGA